MEVLTLKLISSSISKSKDEADGDDAALLVRLGCASPRMSERQTWFSIREELSHS
jgi:hypothetical protein